MEDKNSDNNYISENSIISEIFEDKVRIAVNLKYFLYYFRILLNIIYVLTTLFFILIGNIEITKQYLIISIIYCTLLLISRIIEINFLYLNNYFYAKKESNKYNKLMRKKSKNDNDINSFHQKIIDLEKRKQNLNQHEEKYSTEIKLLKIDSLISKQKNKIQLLENKNKKIVSTYNEFLDLIKLNTEALNCAKKEIDDYISFGNAKKDNEVENIKELKAEYIKQHNLAIKSWKIYIIQKRVQKSENRTYLLSHFKKFFQNRLENKKNKYNFHQKIENEALNEEKKTGILKQFRIFFVFLFVIICQFFPHWLIGVIVLFEILIISFEISKKFCHKTEIRIIFSTSFVLILLSIVGFLQVMISKYFFLFSLYELFQVLNFINITILFIIFDMKITLETIYNKIKSRLNSGIKLNIRSSIKITYFFFSILLLARLVILYINPVHLIVDSHETLHNLVILNYFPIEIIILFILLIILFLFDLFYNSPSLYWVFLEIYVLIMLFVFSGNILSNWYGIDAVALLKSVNLLLSKSYFNTPGLVLNFFYYSSTSYSMLTFFFSSINGTKFFITFLLPLINSIIFIDLFSISHFLYKKNNKYTEKPNKKNINYLIWILITISFIFSPLQIKFTHISNSETIGTISLIILIFTITAKDKEIIKNREILIIFSILLSLFHFSHAFIVVPLSVIYLLYQYSEKQQNHNNPLKNSQFWKYFFLLLSISWGSYLSLEISTLFEGFLIRAMSSLSINIHLSEFVLFSIPRLYYQLKLFTAFFFSIPVIIFLGLCLFSKFHIFKRIEIFLKHVFIQINNINIKLIRFKFYKFVKNQIFPIICFFGLILLFLNQVYSHKEFTFSQFLISLLYFGQAIILGYVLMGFLDLVKSKRDLFMPYMFFYIIFFAITSFYLIAKPLGQVTYASYFFRLINWFIFTQFTLLLRGTFTINNSINFWKSKKNWMLYSFTAIIIFLNLLASLWEYAY